MNEKVPVSFPGWKAALAASNLSPVVKSSHTREIITSSKHCDAQSVPASTLLAKQG
jgi:hypothetical protein